MNEYGWTQWDWLAVVMYLAGMIGFGLYVSRHVKGTQDYFMAGRGLSYPMLIGTLVATWYGSGAIFGTAELAFGVGCAAFIVWCIPAHLGRIPLALFVAPKIRTINGTTIPDLLRSIYARPVALAGAVLIVCYSTRIQDVVSIGIVGNVIFGIDNGLAGCILVAVVVLYSIGGGLWAVVMTDVVQFFLMTTVTVCLLPLAWQAAGGFEGLRAALPPGHFTPTGGMSLSSILVFMLLGLMVYADPAGYQRFGASKNARAAKRSYLTCLMIWLAFDVIMTLLGLCARKLFPELPGGTALLALAIRVLPSFLTGIWICSILAAIMSTLSSFLLVGANTLAWDIYKPYCNPQATEAQLIRTSRIALVVLAAVGCAGAFQFTMVLDAIIFTSGLYVASALVPVTGGLFWPGRLTVMGGLLSMTSGMVVSIVWQALGAPYGIKPVLVALPVSCLAFLIGNACGKPLERRL